MADAPDGTRAHVSITVAIVKCYYFYLRQPIEFSGAIAPENAVLARCRSTAPIDPPWRPVVTKAPPAKPPHGAILKRRVLPFQQYLCIAQGIERTHQLFGLGPLCRIDIGKGEDDARVGSDHEHRRRRERRRRASIMRAKCSSRSRGRAKSTRWRASSFTKPRTDPGHRSFAATPRRGQCDPGPVINRAPD